MKKIVLVLVMVLGCGQLAQAAIFTVTNVNNSGVGSLRDAIVEANDLPGYDEIHFNIPGVGPHTIVLTSNLPEIIDSLKIDGETQPGASCSPRHLMIEVQGSSNSQTFNFAPNSVGSSFRGIAINHQPWGSKIYVAASDFILECSHIGTDITGSNAGGSSISNTGVWIVGGENIIIGGSEELGNVISGNKHGVNISSSLLSKDIRISGNKIGVNWDGTYSIGGQVNGIGVASNGAGEVINLLIGGDSLQERNIISGHERYGIAVSDSINVPVEITLKNNYVGTDVTGNNVISNIEGGVYLGSGRELVKENLIRGNGGSGLRIVHDTKATVLSNTIFENSGLGIDLGNSGVTPNDLGDVDMGPNDLFNFPVLNSASLNGNNLTVKFDLDVKAAHAQVEFFANPLGLDPSGHGEGQIYLGSVGVDTTPSVLTQHTVTIQIPANVSLDEVVNITSTATETSKIDDEKGPSGSTIGATSEFSAGIDVTKVSYDYGDNPDPQNGTSQGNYRTRKADFGASHKIDINKLIYMGTCVDGDSGSLQGWLSEDDDRNVSGPRFGLCSNVVGYVDDEDGVTFPFGHTFVAGKETTIKVHVEGDGYLNAFVDYNRDGDWFDSGEKIINGVALTTGDHTFTILAPQDLKLGDSYARFRYSTIKNLSSISAAPNGEVEDTRVYLFGPQFEGGEPARKWSPVQEGR